MGRLVLCSNWVRQKEKKMAFGENCVGPDCRLVVNVGYSRIESSQVWIDAWRRKSRRATARETES